MRLEDTGAGLGIEQHAGGRAGGGLVGHAARLSPPLNESVSAGSAVYGICVVCHEKTPMARLVAIPATSLCLRCAGKERGRAAAG